MPLPVFKKPCLVLLLALILLAPACSTLTTTADTPTRTNVPLLPSAAPLSASPSLPPPPLETVAPTLPPSPAPSATPVIPPPAPSPLQAQLWEELWRTVNDNYLYPDFNGLDWNAVHAELTQWVALGQTDEQFYQAMYDAILRLGDHHSTFFSPVQAKKMDEQYSGQYDYVGIGVLHTPMPERKLFSVVLVFPGSPAEQAGIQPHDAILSVDGQSLFDEQGNRLNLLRGPAGTTIQVTVQTPGQPPRQLTVTRQSVEADMPTPHQVYTSPAGQRIGYLLIPTFNEGGISAQVGMALSEMSESAPLDGLIVDNRHNTGGASQEMLNTLSYFVSGPAGSFVNKGLQEPVSANGVDVAGSQNFPLVVLIGPDTVSFGEIISGILQDLGRAYLIGQPTRGNVELLSIYNFQDGSRLWLATGAFRPLNHPERVWEKSGVQPDLTVVSLWDQVTQVSDPVIQAALQRLDAR